MFDENRFVLNTVFGELNILSDEVIKNIYEKFNGLFNVHLEFNDIPEAMKNKAINIRGNDGYIYGKIERTKNFVVYSYKDEKYSLNFRCNLSSFTCVFKMLKKENSETEMCFWKLDMRSEHSAQLAYYNNESIQQAKKLGKIVGIKFETVLQDDSYAILPDESDSSCRMLDICPIIDEWFQISDSKKLVK